MKTIPLISAILVSFSLLLGACGSSSRELAIQDAWARPAGAGDNGAVYFVIENGTSTTDTLLSVSSDIASAAEVHKSMADGNGVMSMKMQESIPVPAKEQVEFKPGSLHIMLVGLNQELKVGDTFTVSIHFEKAGDVNVPVEVKE